MGGISYTLQWASYFPFKIATSHGGSGPTSNKLHCCLGSRETAPERHLDRFSRFCRAHDRDIPTDRPRYSVPTGRIYVRSTAMRPNNADLHKLHLDLPL